MCDRTATLQVTEIYAVYFSLHFKMLFLFLLVIQAHKASTNSTRVFFKEGNHIYLPALFTSSQGQSPSSFFTDYVSFALVLFLAVQ